MIPLLPRHVGYLALDWPGHGLSSRIPHGLHYNSQLYLHLLNRIQHHFKWEKVSLLAHSMSGIMSFVYTGLFPDKVDMLAQLDVLKSMNASPARAVVRLRSIVGDEFALSNSRNQKKSEPPSYPYDQIVQRWIKGSSESLSEDSVPHLLRRAICRSAIHPDQFYFTRDSRLKQMAFELMPQQMSLELGSKINVPHLCIKADKSPYYEPKEAFYEVVDLLKKTNPKFEYVKVDGTHHVHLADPGKVSGKLSELILKCRPV